MRTQNFKHRYSLFLLIILSLISCNDFLDVAPQEFYQESDLLEDIVQLEKELTILYNQIPVEYWSLASGNDYGLISGASDEAIMNWAQVPVFLYNQGSWNPSNNPIGKWEISYQCLRTAYHFLEHIDKVPVQDKRRIEEYNILKPRYKLECKFFIALYTFELFKRYGSIPIVDHYFTNEEVTNRTETPRNNVNDVIAFMVTLLDEIAPQLPAVYTGDELGRVTQGAALALKAKILLYAASPLFNGGEIDGVDVTVAGTSVKNTILSLKDVDGSPLFNTTFDKEKWKKAADAAKAVIDLNRYSLHPKQSELFMSRNFTEVIFHRQMGFSTNFERGTGPNGSDYGMWGGLGPSQDLVDSYETINGRYISDPLSGYKESGFSDTSMSVFRNNVWQKVTVPIRNMYMNRDPRFYTDIYFNGMPLFQRNVITEFSTTTGQNNDGWGGKSGQNTRSGYYVQKWNDPSNRVTSNAKSIGRNYPLYRYAEVLLWYAEAMNEYLDIPNQEVYNAINSVRERIGIPPLPITDEDRTKVGMRKRIHNERKIELAFEGHRFWDIRRWLVAHTPEIKAINSLNYNASGEEFYKRMVVQEGGRVFNVNHYLMPIPADEIQKVGSSIIQNYGW